MKRSSLAEIVRAKAARMRMPKLDWIQVEVTSCCNASCTYCPRTVYKESWQNRSLPLDMFLSLKPDMAKTGMIHLQGWGEPFLHPDLFTMIQTAKKEGCLVGTTTNGTLIDDDCIDNIFSSGLDLISFSLAGFGSTNAAIRRGTDSSHITRVIRTIHLKRLALRTPRPRIHISYMLLPSTLWEIESLPHRLAGIGVDEVVISTLDFVAHPDLQREAIRPFSEDDYAGLSAQLDRSVKECRRAGLAVHYRLPSHSAQHASCTENIYSSAFVGAEGAIHPCVFAGIPADGQQYMDTEIQPYSRIHFGTLAETPFPCIWLGDSANEFRVAFAANRGSALCKNCVKRAE
ncbi:MAG TPA: radical SAM protein [Dissulfurispiraceae bacterium]|nr:radical SAM protein [Dissulfurispiraceae bacterium]